MRRGYLLLFQLYFISYYRILLALQSLSPTADSKQVISQGGRKLIRLVVLVLGSSILLLLPL
jgi:hypothetical protein